MPAKKKPAKRRKPIDAVSSPRKPASPRRRSQPARPVKADIPYHHGDLRQALLRTTEELLESSGLEGFTLREVARRAGVSHGAPAHHFGDLCGLLSEFTAQSFEGLAAAMAQHREGASAEAFEQLVATGLGYVEYALTHRARFQLMFRSDRLDWAHQPLIDAGAKAYGHLVECTTQVSASVGAPGHLLERKIALAWSTVHGFATLLIDNRNFAQDVQGDTANALAKMRGVLELIRPAIEGR